MRWRCPECGGDDLSVMVTTSALLTQSDGDFTTDANQADHEWDRWSNMECNKDACHYVSASLVFEVNEAE